MQDGALAIAIYGQPRGLERNRNPLCLLIKKEII